jgi:hypothetical protein
MWDRDDHFARWFQALCALPLVVWCAFGAYLWLSTPYDSYDRTTGAISTSVLGAAYLAYRCLRYAITGRDNINRDDY